MAKINAFPLGTPKSNDLLVGTSIPNPNTNKQPKTKNFAISDITSLVAAEIPQGPEGPIGPIGPIGPQGPAGGVTSVTGGLNITVNPNVGDVEVSAPGAIVNTTDVYTGTPQVANVISLTQAEYDAATIDANTLYVII